MANNRIVGNGLINSISCPTDHRIRIGKIEQGPRLESSEGLGECKKSGPFSNYPISSEVSALCNRKSTCVIDSLPSECIVEYECYDIGHCPSSTSQMFVPSYIHSQYQLESYLQGSNDYSQTTSHTFYSGDHIEFERDPNNEFVCVSTRPVKSFQCSKDINAEKWTCYDGGVFTIRIHAKSGGSARTGRSGEGLILIIMGIFGLIASHIAHIDQI